MLLLFFFNILPNILYFLTDPYARASVRILSWFDDPHKLFLFFSRFDAFLVFNQFSDIFLALEVKG